MLLETQSLYFIELVTVDITFCMYKTKKNKIFCDLLQFFALCCNPKSKVRKRVNSKILNSLSDDCSSICFTRVCSMTRDVSACKKGNRAKCSISQCQLHRFCL